MSNDYSKELSISFVPQEVIHQPRFDNIIVTEDQSVTTPRPPGTAEQATTTDDIGNSFDSRPQAGRGPKIISPPPVEPEKLLGSASQFRTVFKAAPSLKAPLKQLRKYQKAQRQKQERYKREKEEADFVQRQFQHISSLSPRRSSGQEGENGGVPQSAKSFNACPSIQEPTSPVSPGGTTMRSMSPCLPAMAGNEEL